jgi:hypothetical protein
VVAHELPDRDLFRLLSDFYLQPQQETTANETLDFMLI